MGRRRWLALVAVLIASGSSATGAGVSQRTEARLGPPPAPSGIRVAWLADLGVLISDGGGRHRFSIDETFGNDSGPFGMPSWSPDGTTVAYWSWDTKAGQVLTVTHPRGGRRWLLVSAGSGGTRPPPVRVYAYSVASGRMARVIRGLRMAPFVGPGGWVVFGRDLGHPPDYSRLPIQLGRLSDG